MQSVKRSLGCKGCLEVESRGHSGGLALLWDNTFDVKVISYSARHIDAIIEPNGVAPWRFTGIYGYPQGPDKHKTWNLMRELATHSDLPWLLCGDFNCIVSEEEKLNGVDVPQAVMSGFSDAIQDCSLTDMGWTGSFYTWHRRGTYIRLDRGLSSADWLQLFPGAELEVLPTPTSDHNPLLIKLFPKREFRRKQRPFRFEEMWLLDEQCNGVVEKAWNSVVSNGSFDILLAKIAACAAALTEWNRNHFGIVQKRVRDCEKKFKAIRRRIQTSEAQEEEKVLMAEMDSLLERENVMWRQKSRQDWLTHGDRNTKFFHSRATERKRRNTIKSLCGPENNEVSDVVGMGALVNGFYSDLFASGIDSSNFSEVTDTITPMITATDNASLLRPFTPTEVKTALFQMSPSKAPGPDGMPPKFFQHFWYLVGNDVTSACLSYLNSDTVWPEKFNDTNVVLIPKVPEPKSLSDLRPISLCNITYKIISKALANRMQKLLSKCVSISQSAFMPGRLISDNILLASEVIHYLRRKEKGAKCFLAAKLDLSKAYDRMEWNYVRAVMGKFGFDQRWISLVMQCMETVSYNFCLNGEVVTSLVPGRGLRQGDPISPYLFILGLEGLSSMISMAERQGSIHGVKVCPRAPPISHLFFADDSFLFCRANHTEAQYVRSILIAFEKASGQCINLQKSEITFSKNSPEPLRDEIAALLGLKRVEKHGIYLGFLVEVGRSKKKIFTHIKSRIKDLLLSWHSATLSRGGKEVMLKAVAAAIPAYTMSVARLPDGFCREIERLMNGFWWGSTNQKRNTHWLAWERMAIPKIYGGMGFRAMFQFNTAMLCKQGWRILTQPNSLVARVLKAKYFPDCDVLQASLAHTARPSFTWSSILSAQFLLRQGMRKVVGSGTSINIWEDAWLPNDTMRISTPRHSGLNISRVSELMWPGTCTWNAPLLTSLFNPDEVELIQAIPISSAQRQDSWCWNFTPKGHFTVSSAYRLAIQPLIDKHRVRDIDEATWSSLWDLRIPNKIKIFLWRAFRDMLPTTDALRSRKMNIVAGCSRCGCLRESTTHALCTCSKLIGVWNCDIMRMDPGLLTSTSFVNIFRKCMSTLPPDKLHLFTYLCWMSWNARNAVVFDKPLVTTEDITHTSMKLFTEFSEAQSKSSSAAPRLPPPIVKWIPPSLGQVKLNSDAAILTSPGRVGVGAVVRDHQGAIITAISSIVPGAFNPLYGEAIALREALRWCQQFRFQNLIVELDNQTLVNALAGEGGSWCSEFRGLIFDCLHLGSMIQGLQVRHTKREGNKLAHSLAHLPNASHAFNTWLDMVPPPCRDIARRESVFA